MFLSIFYKMTLIIKHIISYVGVETCPRNPDEASLLISKFYYLNQMWWLRAVILALRRQR
jgi:hypothetical protein